MTRILIKHYTMNFFKSSFIALLLLAAVNTFAQGGRDREATKERIEAMRISFITQRLDLSPEEAQKFWPVYNQYRKELEKLIGGEEERELNHKPKPNLDAMSDSEIKKMMEVEMTRQENVLALRRLYLDKFLEVLPVKKVARLFEAERDFQRQLIRRLSDHRRENR